MHECLLAKLRQGMPTLAMNVGCSKKIVDIFFEFQTFLGA
jgi:hypothetical protein